MSADRSPDGRGRPSLFMLLLGAACLIGTASAVGGWPDNGTGAQQWALPVTLVAVGLLVAFFALADKAPFRRGSLAHEAEPTEAEPEGGVPAAPDASGNGGATLAD